MSFFDLVKSGQILGPDNSVDSGLSLQVATLNRKADAQFLSASAAGNVSATVSASALKGGILTSNPTAADITLTTPTAALMVAADPKAAAGEGFYIAVINLSGTKTVTLAAGTGVTIVGAALTDTSTSGSFYARYGNVTSGAESVTIYRV